MIKRISYAALALFLVSVPASVLAQNAPANDAANQPPAVALPDSTAKESPPQPVEGQIVNQDKATLLATAIIGGSVCSPADESVGEVNDLVIKPTGEIEAIVVGVGGFIGIGEKDVAIALNRDEGRAAGCAGFQIAAYMQKLDEEYQQQSALSNKQISEPGQYPTVPAPQQ